MKMTLLLSLLTSLSFATVSSALELGAPAMNGNGCPMGSASITLSPDYKELTILFDQYVAEAGGSTRRSFDRKSCNLSIPVRVPAGFQFSIIQVDYRGYASIPFGGEGRFNVEYFFAGQRGPVAQKTFTGGYDRDYLLTNSLAASTWSRCGDDVNLRVNSAMLVKSNSSGQQVMATVDSTDVSAAILYRLNVRPCRF